MPNIRFTTTTITAVIIAALAALMLIIWLGACTMDPAALAPLELACP